MKTNRLHDHAPHHSPAASSADFSARPASRVRRLALVAAGCVLALAGAVSANAVNPASLLIPPLNMFAKPTGACSGGVGTNGFNNPTITVYVGQDIDFVIAAQNAGMMTHIWEYVGSTGSGVMGTTLGYEVCTYAWGSVGTFTVLMKNTQGNAENSMTVKVLAETFVPIQARITADNSYVFGFGSAGGMTTSMPAVDNTVASEIFGCTSGAETYTFSAPLHGYLYIAVWDDESVTQGVLGQFKRLGGWPWGQFTKAAVTGNPAWQVYATGVEYDSLPEPGPTLINEQIGVANVNGGLPDLTSIGWVTDGSSSSCVNDVADGYLVVGENNNNVATNGDCYVSQFGRVCGISSLAQWMWYDFPASGSVCPFTQSGLQREFLIFRLPVSALPPVFTGYLANDVGLGTPGSGPILVGPTSTGGGMSGDATAHP